MLAPAVRPRPALQALTLALLCLLGSACVLETDTAEDRWDPLEAAAPEDDAFGAAAQEPELEESERGPEQERLPAPLARDEAGDLWAQAEPDPDPWVPRKAPEDR